MSTAKKISLLTDREIQELKELVLTEHGAFWKTGDWLVTKIDGRNEAVLDAARRLDVKPKTITDRELTSRHFPSNRRHLNLSWTLHRRFAEQEKAAEQRKEKVADWMDEFIATGANPTIREAAAWMERVKGRKSNAGQESAAAMARSITAVRDPAAKVAKVIAALPPQIRAAAVAKTVQTNPETAGRTVARTPKARQAATEQEHFDHEAKVITGGGRIPSTKEINSGVDTPMDGIIEAEYGFERANRLMGLVLTQLRETPPSSDVQRDIVRNWAVSLMDVLERTPVR